MACWVSLNTGRNDLRDPTTLVMSTFPLITRWWPQTQCDPGLLCWLFWCKVWWSCGEGRASWQKRGRQQSPAIQDRFLWILALALAGSDVVELVSSTAASGGSGSLRMNLRFASPERHLPCRVHSVKAIELRRKVGLLVGHWLRTLVIVWTARMLQEVECRQESSLWCKGMPLPRAKSVVFLKLKGSES